MSSLMEEALQILSDEGFSLPNDVITTLTGIRGNRTRMENRVEPQPESHEGQRLSDSRKWTTVQTDVEGRDRVGGREYSRSASDSRTRYSDTDQGITNESGYDTDLRGRSHMSSSTDSKREGYSSRHPNDHENLPYRVSHPPSESGFSDRKQDGGQYMPNLSCRSESGESTSTTSTVREASVADQNLSSIDKERYRTSSLASDSGVGCSSTQSNSNSTLDQFGFDIAEGLSQDARVQNLRNNSKDIANKLSEQIGGQGWAQTHQPSTAVSAHGSCTEIGKQDNTTTSTQSQSVGASSSMDAKQEMKKEDDKGVEAQTAEKKYSDESKSDFTKTSKKTELEGATESELCVEKKDTSKTFASEMDTKCFSKQDDNSASRGSTTTSKQDSGYFAADSQLNTSEVTTKDGKKLKRQESISSTATSAAMSQAKVSEEQHVAQNVDVSGNVIEDVTKSNKEETSTSQTSSTSSSSVVKEDGPPGSGNMLTGDLRGANNSLQLSRQDSVSSLTSAQSSKTMKEENFQETKSSTTKQGSSMTSSSKVSSKNQSTSESKSESKSVNENQNRISNSSSNVSSSTFNKQENNVEERNNVNSASKNANRRNSDKTSAMGPSVFDPTHGCYVNEPQTPCQSESAHGFAGISHPTRLGSQSSRLSRQDSTSSSIDSSASAMQRRVSNDRQSSFDDNVFDTIDSNTKLKEATGRAYGRSGSDFSIPASSSRRANVQSGSSVDRRDDFLSSMKSSFDDDSRYASRSKYTSEFDDMVGNYSSRTLPSRRRGEDSSSKYVSPYSKPCTSQDDLHGISTKRTSQSSSNRRATLQEGVYLTEKEIFEARQDVRKILSGDGDTLVTTKDSTRNESTIGRGCGGVYKTNTKEDKTDSVTKEFLRNEDDEHIFSNRRDGLGTRHGKKTSQLSDRELRETLLREVTSPLAHGNDRYLHNSRYLTGELDDESIFTSSLESRSQANSRARKSMASDMNSSSISTSRRDATGESFDYKNVAGDNSRRQQSGSSRRQVDRGLNMSGGTESRREYLRHTNSQDGKTSRSYDDIRGEPKKEGSKVGISGNQPPEFALKTDDKVPWNERRKRIDTALSWIRSELGSLRTQDKLLTSQFQRCQDSIEQLKKQRPWYDGFSDDDDDDRHWEDWEIEDFDKSCQNDKYFSKSHLDPKSGTLFTSQRQRMTLHEVGGI